jgi:hypothetical protein
MVYTDHENNTYNGLKALDRVFRWLLLPEEYGVTNEYLLEKKCNITVANALSHLDIDNLKIQDDKEEVLTLLSESENSSISNIKLIAPMNTILIFN